MRFEIRVKPGAKTDRIGGSWGEQGALVVAVRAPALDGKANTAATEVLASAFGVGRRSVRLVTGAKSRTKLIELIDPPADAPERLHQLLTGV